RRIRRSRQADLGERGTFWQVAQLRGSGSMAVDDQAAVVRAYFFFGANREARGAGPPFDRVAFVDSGGHRVVPVDALELDAAISKGSGERTLGVDGLDDNGRGSDQTVQLYETQHLFGHFGSPRIAAAIGYPEGAAEVAERLAAVAVIGLT